MGKDYISEQIVRNLWEAKSKLANGATVPEVARGWAISEAAFYRWRKQYGGFVLGT